MIVRCFPLLIIFYVRGKYLPPSLDVISDFNKKNLTNIDFVLNNSALISGCVTLLIITKIIGNIKIFRGNTKKLYNHI